MKELKKFCPTRRSLQFDQVDQHHPGEFYEFHFNKLFVDVHAFVSLVFCPGNKTWGSSQSPWLQGHLDEFIKYVELVARPDPHTGSWDRLLRDNTERSYLLQAAIMRVLDAQVFSSLLFGADSEHREILKSTDASLVNAEGFRRSNLRAQTNRVYLETKRGQPPLFWEEVDKRCAQVLALLMPIYTWASDAEGWHPPSIQDLYQWLHDVISYAGWINVCIRLSPAIILFNWVTPGELYHVDQINLSQDVYEFSRQLVRSREKRRQARIWLPAGSRKMTARVKMSVAPEIVRYKPVADRAGEEGMKTYMIMKPHVLYYHGWQLDDDDDQEYVKLPEYIRRLRDRTTAPYGAAFLIMLFMFVWLWVKFLPSGQHAWQIIQQGLSPTSEWEL